MFEKHSPTHPTQAASMTQHAPVASPSASQSPARGTHQHILALQQMVGNRAVTRLLTNRQVQRRASSSASDGTPQAENAETIIRAAQMGIETPAQQLPYYEQIQRAFGRHDISHIQAHFGPQAAQSAEAMQATAYATGTHVVFGNTPSLYTAAHEAAHVVQQRSGVHLSAGISEEGDTYERHADAVAERVVASQSAADLLAGDARSDDGSVSHENNASPIQRLQLTPEQIAALRGRNPRELRMLLTQAEEDRDRLQEQIVSAQSLLDMQRMQAAIVQSLGNNPALYQNLLAISQQTRAQVITLQQERNRIQNTVLARVQQQLTGEVQQYIQGKINRELGTPLFGVSPFELEQRRQQLAAEASVSPEIEQRRQQLVQAELNRSPELANQLFTANQVLQQAETNAQQVQVRLQQVLNAMQQQMNQVVQQLQREGAPTARLADNVLSVIQSFQSNSSPDRLQARLQEIQQELYHTNIARQAIADVRQRTGLIAVSQDVIAEVQTMLHVGAGNQITDLQRTRGLSGELTTLVRSIARMPTHNRLLQISQEALLASILHAGNCGEHASIAFVLLWQRLAGYQLTYYAHSIDHAFVVIGDPHNPDAVVCDPWPREAMAVTLRDFFVRTGIRNPRNIRFRGQANGRDLMAEARPTVDLETAENRMEEERPEMTEEEANATFTGPGIYHRVSTHRADN